MKNWLFEVRKNKRSGSGEFTISADDVSGTFTCSREPGFNFCTNLDVVKHQIGIYRKMLQYTLSLRDSLAGNYGVLFGKLADDYANAETHESAAKAMKTLKQLFAEINQSEMADEDLADHDMVENELNRLIGG